MIFITATQRQAHYIQNETHMKPFLFSEYRLTECQRKSNQDNDPVHHVVRMFYSICEGEHIWKMEFNYQMFAIVKGRHFCLTNMSRDETYCKEGTRQHRWDSQECCRTLWSG